MTTQIDEQVSVSLAYDTNNGKVFPYVMKRKNEIIKFEKLGFHHKVYEGKDLIHYFHLVANGTFFKLRLNTNTLSWRLIEIASPA